MTAEEEIIKLRRTYHLLMEARRTLGNAHSSYIEIENIAAGLKDKMKHWVFKDYCLKSGFQYNKVTINITEEQVVKE